MKNSVARNYFYNTSYQVLTLLTPLITTPYLARVLGAEGIGIYSYTTSIVSYFVLFASLGVANYAQREIAYHQNNRYEQSRIFFEVVAIQALLVGLSLLSYYLIISEWATDRYVYWVQALNILFVLFDISWFFQGLEEFGKIVIRNCIVRLLNIACIFLFIHDASDLLLYIALAGGMNVLAGISIWLYLPQYLVVVKWRDIKLFRNFKTILQLFLPQIAIQIYTVLDKTMIGVITHSMLQNGYYEQSQKIIRMVLMIVTSLGPVMIPRIAALHSQRDYERIDFYIMRSYRFVWMLGLPMMILLILLIDGVIPWFFGPGYEDVGILVKIFTGLLLAIGINNVTGVQYLIPVGQQNIFTMTVVVGAILNFGLNLLLIPTFAAVGAAMASLIQFYFVRDRFSLKKVLLISKNYLVAGLIMGGVVEILAHLFWSAPVFLDTTILSFVGLLAYASVLYLLKDTFFMEYSGKISRKARGRA